MPGVNIETYTDAHKKGVADLILNIQNAEFGIPISLEDQPDLNEIPGFYQINKGNFWIAKIGNKIVGTISLLDIGDHKGALRKMFVDKNYRGKEFSVGTEKFTRAQKFYQKNDFIEIAKQELPKTFPIMEVDIKFYRLSI